MQYYWNDETIEYFVDKDWREVFEFVKQNCTLEDGETYEMLGNDLMNRVQKAKLVSEIWEYVKTTHNKKDYEDLQEFSLKELEEILTDIKLNR